MKPTLPTPITPIWAAVCMFLSLLPLHRTPSQTLLGKGGDRQPWPLLIPPLWFNLLRWKFPNMKGSGITHFLPTVTSSNFSVFICHHSHPQHPWMLCLEAAPRPLDSWLKHHLLCKSFARAHIGCAVPSPAEPWVPIHLVTPAEAGVHSPDCVWLLYPLRKGKGSCVMDFPARISLLKAQHWISICWINGRIVDAQNLVNDCSYDIPQALLRMLFSLPSKAFSNRWHAFSHQGFKSTQPCTPSPHSLSGCCHFSCPVLCTLPPSPLPPAPADLGGLPHPTSPGNLSWDFCLDLNHTLKGPSSMNLSGSPQPLVSPLPLKLLIVS